MIDEKIQSGISKKLKLKNYKFWHAEQSSVSKTTGSNSHSNPNRFTQFTQILHKLRHSEHEDDVDEVQQEVDEAKHLMKPKL